MMTAPTALDLKRENIPRELKELDQWVGWRWKQIGEKWTKVPCSLQTNRAASSNDRETWSSYYETEGHENIGFMFSEDDTYCGIDLDACRNPETGEITKLARQIIDRMASYSGQPERDRGEDIHQGRSLRPAAQKPEEEDRGL